MAITIFNALSDGMGGLDFGKGLDRLIEFFGIQDEDALIERLLVIKSHVPKEPMT